MHDKPNCCLCSQIAGRRENDLISHLAHDKQYIRRVAMESENFVVIPSLGPIVPGHTLLCPKQHVKSIAYLQASHYDEYLLMKQKLRYTLGYLFDVPIHCFEHGANPKSSRVLCTVDHAHLHLLPVYMNVAEALTKKLRWRFIEATLYDLRNNVGTKEYLYYESPDGIAMVTIADENGFESQYMRRIFADSIGKPGKWNWRLNPRPHEADKTFRAIRDLELNKVGDKNSLFVGGE